MDQACAIHTWEPVERCRAVYRCSACGAFAYKGKARVGDFATSNDLTLYKCYHPGCPERVVKLYPVVKGYRKQQPSCQLHRKDKASLPPDSNGGTIKL